MPTDPYARLTAIILAQIETADPASWSPPWHGTNPLPVNALTGRRYRGLNVLVLWATAQAQGYADPRWATYRQWAALGAQVRKAERGTPVIFYKDLPPDAYGGVDADQHGPRFVARASHVFNAAQVDDAPDQAGADHASPCVDLDAAAEQILADFIAVTGAVIIPGGTRAAYTPATDNIRLPDRSAFHTTTGYAATVAHELVHWTGAPHRLARNLSTRFGDRTYAAEELVAEIGAAFISADLRLARTPHLDHAAYCANWLPLLRADPRALATAASLAGRAAAYLSTFRVDADGDIRCSISGHEAVKIGAAA
ncbi:zincin-like metallopeptidase domain-containing protein [Methylobacterium sp. Leaf469]|uniref:ArdC family protein n=1 Tax=Methylobacterium sp. Leaf469 TaxID=1736387 RepID=UPI0009EB6861|nr:zincin-like metallopeptidase domain-containing protein [Methylobacterium sp. Leaf469]